MSSELAKLEEEFRKVCQERIDMYDRNIVVLGKGNEKLAEDIKQVGGTATIEGAIMDLHRGFGMLARIMNIELRSIHKTLEEVEIHRYRRWYEREHIFSSLNDIITRLNEVGPLKGELDSLKNELSKYTKDYFEQDKPVINQMRDIVARKVKELDELEAKQDELAKKNGVRIA